MTPNCLICKQPLSPGEVSLNRQWHFDCQKCHYCGHELPAPDIIQKCLDANIPPSHETCHKTHLFADFKSKKLPLEMEHLKALNEEVLSFWPAVNPDESDLTAIYDYMIRLQECAVNASWILSLTKDKLSIRRNENFNHQIAERKKVEKEKQLESETEKIERQTRSAQLAAERDNPRLRNRRKAVQGLIDIFTAAGLTKEDATTKAESSIPQVN